MTFLIQFYRQQKLSLLFVLYGIGLALSHMLTENHAIAKIAKKLGENSDRGICGAHSIFSCQEAATSSFGQIAGLPISALGEAYYLTCVIVLSKILFFAFRMHFSQHELVTDSYTKVKESYRIKLIEIASFFLNVGAVLSLGYSIFLAMISTFVLGKLCPLCIGLYLVNIGAFLILWPGIRQLFSVQKVRAQLTNTWLILVLVLFALSVLTTQGVYSNLYRAEFELRKNDLKKANPPVFFKEVPEIAHSPVKGSGEITIFEFSDFQCPFCKRLSANLKEAQAKNPNFKYVFKNYPLSAQCNDRMKANMHPDACLAAKAGICAQNFGKFWELHDIMFENQHDLGENDLLGYAENLGLNRDAFEQCLSAPQTEQTLKADLALATKYQVQGTPIFIINHWAFVGAKPADEILELIKTYADLKTQKVEK
jgi:protein-disulfide isomerase/uncharacterized membrane protein